MLKQSEIADRRRQTVEELEDEVLKLSRRLYQLRQKKVVEELENPHEVRHIRRTIAQIKTIQSEKRQAEKNQ